MQLSKEQAKTVVEIESVFMETVESTPCIMEIYNDFCDEMKGAELPLYMFNLIFFKDLVNELSVRLMVKEDQLIPRIN